MPNRYISSKDRLFVFLRAKNRCEYCQCRSDVALETFEVEHIIPLSKGGNNSLDNLALSCRGCNSRKSVHTYIIDQRTQEKIPLFNPRSDIWKEHFQWSENFLEVIGKTEVGKVTVQILRLNRLGVVNIRRLMALGNLHPPLDTI